MSKLMSLRTACWASVFMAAAGCSSQKAAIYDHENFDDAGTFSRSYPVSDNASCEAARRALLSQGYIITSSDPKMISGHKSFQQTGETHMEISFNVVCASDGSHDQRSSMFANALQDRYALKKTNSSASLGVGVLGSVSMPIGSTDDSMVKVASETVASQKFYDRFFVLVENFLPPEAKKAAHIPEKSRADTTDLGMPEPVATAAAPEAKPAEPKPAEIKPVEPKAAEPKATEPNAAEPKAVEPQPVETKVPEPAATPAASEPVPAPADHEPVKVQAPAPVPAPAPVEPATP